MWDVSACGGLHSGENKEAAAARELEEESGLKDVPLRYVESFMNIFPGENGELRKRLSHLYLGVSDEIPQPNNEVDDFRAWYPNELLADIEASPSHYIPSFVTELKIALKGYEQLIKR